MGLGVALLAARLRWRLAATTFAVLALALVAADLFKAGMGATPAITTDQATQPSTPGLEFLRRQRPNRFVGIQRPIGPSPLVPNASMRVGLYDARGWDPPVEERYDTLWRRAVLDGGPTDVPTTSAKLTDAALPAFRLLSVTDIAAGPRRPAGRAAVAAAALRRARPARLRDAAPAARAPVWSTPSRSCPATTRSCRRCWIPDSTAAARSSPRGRCRGCARARAAGPPAAPGSPTYEPERVVVDATARRPAELVLTDLHYPGWKVTVDGEPAALHRVDYLLRGATLPAGRHRVEFRYQPASFRIGWIVSLLALAGLIATLAVGLRRRRG